MIRADQRVSAHRVKRSQLGIVRERVVLQRGGFERENDQMTRNSAPRVECRRVRSRNVAVGKAICSCAANRSDRVRTGASAGVRAARQSGQRDRCPKPSSQNGAIRPKGGSGAEDQRTAEQKRHRAG